VDFSPKAEQILVHYHWPGNIRELENIVERAVNLVDGRVIEPEHLGSLQARSKKRFFTKCQGSLLAEVEKQTILESIEAMESNISRAAKMLGITRATLYKKIKKYNLPISRGIV